MYFHLHETVTEPVCKYIEMGNMLIYIGIFFFRKVLHLNIAF